MRTKLSERVIRHRMKAPHARNSNESYLLFDFVRVIINEQIGNIINSIETN